MGMMGGGGPTTTPSPNIAGNWSFSTTSTASGSPLTISGSINESTSSVSAALHIDGSACFDHLTTMSLTGNLTGFDLSLTSMSVGGQVITINGGITNNGLTGTYSINGGCASGDQGKVTGIRIPIVANTLNGTFTASGGNTFNMATDVTQNSTSSMGSFGISGIVSFNTSCFNSGSITSGIFPSASFILGTSVVLEIKTGNGIISFVGTLNRDKGEITGTYTVSGGSCDQSGTAVLVASSPWDY
jgi:hypothetical protein